MATVPYSVVWIVATCWHTIWAALLTHLRSFCKVLRLGKENIRPLCKGYLSHMSHALCSLSNVVLNISHTASSLLGKNMVLDACVVLAPAMPDPGSPPGWGVGLACSLLRRIYRNYWTCSSKGIGWGKKDGGDRRHNHSVTFLKYKWWAHEKSNHNFLSSNLENKGMLLPQSRSSKQAEFLNRRAVSQGSLSDIH